MSKYKIKKVETEQEMTQFIRFSEQLYARCPYYVPDMESEIRAYFDPKSNPGLEFSSIQPFLCIDVDGNVVGRIAGIINPVANETWQVKNVRFGYIDFIDDIEVSGALLDAVAEWGRAQGMKRIQGPMGISDFDKEGMLVEDFDKVGSEVTIYNYPYYPKHMEQLGFQKEADWIQIRVDVPKEVPERFSHVSALLKKRYGWRVHKMISREIEKEGYGRKVFQLLNEAYQPLFGFSKLSDRQVDAFVKKYLTLVDLNLAPCIVDKEGNLIGVAITMASLTRALQKSKGRLLPWGWYHLLKSLKWKHEDHVEMLLIAVKPEYQRLGVNALMFDDLIPVYNRYHFKYAETGPQLEDNEKELNQWRTLNPTFEKRHRCYGKDL